MSALRHQEMLLRGPYDSGEPTSTSGTDGRVGLTPGREPK